LAGVLGYYQWNASGQEAEVRGRGDVSARIALSDARLDEDSGNINDFDF